MKRVLLPKKLENFVFSNLDKSLRGRLHANYEEVKDTLRIYGSELQNYSAVYGLRSSAEAKEICEDLLGVPIINKTFKNKENINILDIGSGTGGNLMGLLWCLKENKLLDNKKKVSVVSIDGNEKALEYQEKMRKELFPRVSWRPEKKEFEYKENFKNQINEIVSGNKFDIIMSFQFVNELYRKKYKKFHPLYKIMAELAYRYLKKDGLFILSDVNDKEESLPHHFSQLMNSEIIPYLQKEKETGLKCIIPLSCAFWYKECKRCYKCFQQKFFKVYYRHEDYFKKEEKERRSSTGFKSINSKVVYKVFAHNELADKIFPQQLEKKDKDIYRISEGSKEKNFCDKGEPKSESNLSEKQRNAPDAFALSSLLK